MNRLQDILAHGSKIEQLKSHLIVNSSVHKPIKILHTANPLKKEDNGSLTLALEKSINDLLLGFNGVVPAEPIVLLVEFDSFDSANNGDIKRIEDIIPSLLQKHPHINGILISFASIDKESFIGSSDNILNNFILGLNTNANQVDKLFPKPFMRIDEHGTCEMYTENLQPLRTPAYNNKSYN